MRFVKCVFGVWVVYCCLLSGSLFAASTFMTPNGPQVYAKDAIVAGSGMWDPAAGNNGQMDFVTLDPFGVPVADPNQAATGFLIVDLGAPFGFPNLMLVWYGTANPNANGWTPSPLGNVVILGVPIPFPTPDHVIVLSKVQFGIEIEEARNGTHLVF